jgi:uncharacterized protein YwqG
MHRYSEQRRALGDLLRAALPAKPAAHIESLIRDVIAIVPRKARKADAALGVSRLGGAPDLPAGESWPAMDGGEVHFVAQLRLEDIAPLDLHRSLPARGLLSFFQGFGTEGEYVIEGQVRYFPDAPKGLAPLPRPGRRKGFEIVGVDFEPRAMLPPHSSGLVPFEGADDPYVALFDEHYRTYTEGDDYARFHGLFGFDRPRELEQRDGERMLLRLDAADGVAYEFVESVCAYYWIPEAALAATDFTQARLYEGASI